MSVDVKSVAGDADVGVQLLATFESVSNAVGQVVERDVEVVALVATVDRDVGEAGSGDFHELIMRHFPAEPKEWKPSIRDGKPSHVIAAGWDPVTFLHLRPNCHSGPGCFLLWTVSPVEFTYHFVPKVEFNSPVFPNWEFLSPVCAILRFLLSSSEIVLPNMWFFSPICASLIFCFVSSVCEVPVVSYLVEV